MKQFLLPVFGLLILCLAGCVSIDYVGQDFPPLAPGQAILFFDEKNPVPAGEYQVIGRAEMEVPSGYGSVEIREKLSDEARSHGASAIRIVKVEKQLVNSYYELTGGDGEPGLAGRSSAGAIPMQLDGTHPEINSFGDVALHNRSYRQEYRTHLKLLMLMTRKDYEKALQDRREAAEWVPAPAPSVKTPEPAQ